MKNIKMIKNNHMLAGKKSKWGITRRRGVGRWVRSWRKQQRNPGKRKQRWSHNILFISDLCISIFIQRRWDSFWTINHFCKIWQVVFHWESFFHFLFLPFQRPTDHVTKLSITSAAWQSSNFGCTGKHIHSLSRMQLVWWFQLQISAAL